MAEVSIRVNETPNPDAQRFVVDRPVQEQSKGRFFTSAEQTDEPLVTSLFAIEGVTAVMLLPTSVTVNKTKDQGWDVVEPKVRAAIEEYFA